MAASPAFARAARNAWAQAHARTKVCPSTTIDQWASEPSLCRCGHPETHATVAATVAARKARKLARKGASPKASAKAAPKASKKAKAGKLTARQIRERAAYEARTTQGQASAHEDADAVLQAQIKAAKAALRKLTAQAKASATPAQATQARLQGTKAGAASPAHSAVTCK